MAKFLYFKTEATRANEDATGDSACFPSSSLMGMQPTSDTALTLYFKSMARRTPSGNEPDADASFDNHDTVILNLLHANTHLKAIRAITEAASSQVEGVTVIANDDASGQKEYLANAGILSCGAIAVSAAYAN